MYKHAQKEYIIQAVLLEYTRLKLLGKKSIDIYNTKGPHLNHNMHTPDKVDKKSEENK